MNKFFDEILIVGLERCQDRIKFVTDQLDKFNLPYKVYPAFDGKDIINESMSKLTRAPFKAFKKLGKRLRYLPGMLACGLSHIGVMKYAQMMDLKGVLILEDDVVFADDFVDRLKYLDEVPDDAQIIYLGAISTNENLSKKYKITDHVWDVKKMTLYATHAYIVTRAGYKAIIKKMMECEDSCDALLVDGLDKGEFKGYALLPFPTYQSEGISEVDHKIKNSNNTKTLYSPDDNIQNICGYDRETKSNKKDTGQEISLIKPKVKSLF